MVPQIWKCYSTFVLAVFGDAQRVGLGEGGEIEFRPPGTAAD